MEQHVKASKGCGPLRKSGAISITFDNLGEAAALQRGDTISQLGEDPTAKFIDVLLKELGDLPATYFIEASNTELYPKQILKWFKAGKEVGVHGWRHEHWGKLEPDTRRRVLDRSLAAFRNWGIETPGFRPPGGVCTSEMLDELRDYGFKYCSPLGSLGGATYANGVSLLPFIWHHVDAYLLDPSLGAMRERNGDAALPHSSAQWDAVLDEAIQFAASENQHVCIIFHPYLLLSSPDHLASLRRFIGKVRGHKDIWCASAFDVSEALKP